MSERVVVYQDRSFQTNFKAADPNDKESNDVENVMHLHELTPYGMLLASVAACTTIVVNSYARHHNIPLKGVTVDAAYDRAFIEDCEGCDEDEKFEEIITESVEFEGDLDESQRHRLHQVAKACSVRRVLERGIRVETK